MSAVHDEADDDLSNSEQSAEDSLLARLIAAQATHALWVALLVGAPLPAPGVWHVYHSGHLYKGGRRVGAIARELAKRGLAELAQRRAGKGFDYLIAMRKTAGEPAKVVAFSSQGRPLAAETVIEAEPIPRTEIASRVLALDDQGKSITEIAAALGTYYQRVRAVLAEHGRIKSRTPTSAGRIG